MRALRIDQLKPGFVLGKALMDEAGTVLLHRGVKLTEDYIQALQAKGYSHLYVKEPDDTTTVEIEEDLSQELRSRAFSTLKKAFDTIGREFDAVRAESEADIAKACDSDRVKALMSEKGPLSKVPDIVSAILGEVLDRTTLAGLTSMKNDSTALYDHSIDTCVIAIMIGQVILLPTDKMRQLATGCLLHDIGKIAVEPTGDRERDIRLHTQAGYELLRRSEQSEMLSPYVAYEHHEHQDGTGLPRGLRGSNALRRNREVDTAIPTLVGEIAAVANAFDNLVSGSSNGTPMTVDEALGMISADAGTRYNREIVAAFRRVVPVYPKGTEVVLRGDPFDGFRAIVADVNPKRLHRPTVQLLADSHFRRVEPDEIDLFAHPTVALRSVGL
jgi:putative nucleotidyltransferase with HDIG domain